MAWQQIGNLRGNPGPPGSQGVPGPAGVGEIGPQGLKGDPGPPGQTATIIGSFTNRAISELPPSGYVPKDWDSPGNPPAGNQFANGQGMLYTPTQEVCLWVGPTLTPDGWVVLGAVQGPPGPAGESGQTGSQGIQGVPGIQGDMGPAGPIGPIGIGVKGDKGDKGDVGATGGIGPTGPVGSVGPAGPTAVSADAGNLARLGTDSLLLVPDSAVHKGVTDGSNAAVGMLGEVLAANNTSGVSLTTNVAANIATLTLTAGDWSINGLVIIVPSGTGPNGIVAAVSTVSATVPTDNQVLAGTGIATQVWSSSMTSNKEQTLPTGTVRVNVSVPTNIYLVGLCAFGGGSVVATGRITARRMR